MVLKENLNRDCVRIGASGANKTDILHEIAELAEKSDVLKNIPQQKIYDALLEREKIGSTAFGNNIAIPHCFLDNISDFVVGVLVSKDGVDFDAQDDKPVHLFFFIIGPTGERNRHIQILLGISRLLRSEPIRNSLINSETPEELLETIFSQSETTDAIKGQTELVMFHIFIQNEKYFDDLLQLVSGAANGAVTVVETVNVGNYLNVMPLFASFWTGGKDRFSRLIIAVVDKKLANNVIRKVNNLIPEIKEKSGVFISASDLFYANGQIDF
ncbi:MAG: PTS sugar transporter subunit IIA [Spirochaetales bacterium]|nr:PTS sugar transporter subunit IIA [Spirochaetales bacterium]